MNAMTKMKKWYFIPIILLFSLFLYVAVYAAGGVPLIFSYQGRLTDVNGDLLTGTYHFKFSIWNVATGGTTGTNRLWPTAGPSSVSITVREGVFQVNIGDTANGYPDTLDYDFTTNVNIFLQVEVSPNNVVFEAFSPRQRIPSAIFAQVARAVIFGNQFELKQVSSSTTIMYDSSGNEVLIFDEGE